MNDDEVLVLSFGDLKRVFAELPAVAKSATEEFSIDIQHGEGVRRIAAARLRQLKSEGWSVDRDADHSKNELALAAATYALPESERETSWFVVATDLPGSTVEVSRPGWKKPAVACFKHSDPDGMPRRWPWSKGNWRPEPHDRIRELEKAGALIAAEIDRLIAEQKEKKR